MSITQEEARIELQAMKDTFEEYEPGGSRCQIALNVALSALRPVSREQVEKVWRGGWIGIPNMGVYDIACSKCGYSTGIRFWSSDFCPNCGAPMTDEAVDMVMERVGALYGQENT